MTLPSRETPTRGSLNLKSPSSLVYPSHHVCVPSALRIRMRLFWESLTYSVPSGPSAVPIGCAASSSVAPASTTLKNGAADAAGEGVVAGDGFAVGVVVGAARRAATRGSAGSARAAPRARPLFGRGGA